MEAVTDFLSLGSTVTVDGDCSHEIRRCILLGRKAVTNLDSILESKDIIFPTKICIGKSFQQSCTDVRIDAFEFWCWRRLLRVPSTARRSNQSILSEINLEYSLERLMLKLKLQ